ncbi:xylosidase glycosyl [Moniliophthora roreri MCA 2997]|uniref:Xylosidase glycosyl n=1 Tax=Moniliophthora roreri (strain MCA 2997) TaxID=1381753 RepID=V2XFY6_MONRO|nr:xylosidase glycosyl [Moniliophthora roreri MCA 2997]
MRPFISSSLLLVAIAIRSASAVAVWGQNSTTEAIGKRQDTFTNPVIWEDLADLDVFRVDNTYYYSASTMHYSPGAPILSSKDLVNWNYIGHSVPSLDFGSNNYNLPGGGAQAYVKGIWASTLRFRRSTNTWYWIGCIEFAKTYIYTAHSVTGPWKQASVLNTCYYDVGLLIDDDGSMYVAYGNTDIHVAQLSDDGLNEVRNQLVYSSTVGTLEGSRFYKRDGAYYILTTKPATDEWVLKSTNGPFGPYTIQPLVRSARSPTTINGGNPHQGGLVEDGTNWYYMAFVDSYPGGRIPVLAPVTWSSDGWPSLKISNNAWGNSYPYPLTPQPGPPLTGIDKFTEIGPQWEWNHNPDNEHWSIDSGLVLQTATVTDDLYAARNTITHRILGPKSSGTILLDLTKMADGDRAGISMLRDVSAWIGVKRTGGTKKIVMVNGMTMNTNWATTSTGNEVATASLDGNQIWLRATADIQPGGSNSATFSYSTNGNTFTNLGNTLKMNTDWRFFMGYRFGIFNFATSALGGSVTVKSFELQEA